jgi:hypothetical protein
MKDLSGHRVVTAEICTCLLGALLTISCRAIVVLLLTLRLRADHPKAAAKRLYPCRLDKEFSMFGDYPAAFAAELRFVFEPVFDVFVLFLSRIGLRTLKCTDLGCSNSNETLYMALYVYDHTGQSGNCFVEICRSSRTVLNNTLCTDHEPLSSDCGSTRVYIPAAHFCTKPFNGQC